MRLAGALWFVVSAACYHAPIVDPACSILCTAGCPDDMHCTNGVCVAAGQTCAPTFREVRAGNGFACALDTNSLLWCWGSNAHRQLDPGDAPYFDLVTRVGTDRWDTIATGGGQICGIHDGVLACWGANDRGQVTGASNGDVVSPSQIDAPNGAPWTFVAAGYADTCAIAGGTLYCWGAGDVNQLGNGSTQDAGEPTPVTTPLSDWTVVSTSSTLGYGHSCAISASAGLFCWGVGTSGELGDGLAMNQPTPVAASLPGNPVSVAVGLYSTCAVDDLGKLYCWGYAVDHALGDPATIAPSGTRTTPTIASGLDGWTSVVAAEELGCALRGDEVWCWGATRGGGLANGIWGGSGWGLVATGASDATVGWNASLTDTGVDEADLDLGCMLVGGALQCWGDNRYGQLARGAAVMNPTPVEIAGGHAWTRLYAGATHTCGIDDHRALYCWGDTRFGQSNGVPTGTSSVPCGSAPDLDCDLGSPKRLPFEPTADAMGLGTAFSCALDAGAITCWGDNSFGQLGTLAAASGPPIQVPGTWTAIYDVGMAAACAVTGGQTECWGVLASTTKTAPTPVPALDGVITIRASGTPFPMAPSWFGCALDSARSLACYGFDQLGQYGNGSGPSTTCGNAVCDAGETCASCPSDCGACPLSSLGRTYGELSIGWGSDRTGGLGCGVRADGKVECWGRNYFACAGVIDATGKAPGYVYTPVELAGLADCTAVSASDFHACAICGGDIYCWGDHRHGGVGAGLLTATPISVPRKLDLKLADGDSWQQLTSGVAFTCARTQLGHGYCWGLSLHGALGTGATSANLPVPVQLAP